MHPVLAAVATHDPAIQGVGYLLGLDFPRVPEKTRPVLVADTARFRAADDPAMVMAAFACPYCLRTASAAQLTAVDDGTAVAECRCDVCEEQWVIGLIAMQALRMRLSPPLRPHLTWQPVRG